MRSGISVLALAAALPCCAATFTYSAEGAWAEALASLGLVSAPASEADVVVIGAAAASNGNWAARVDEGTVLVIEGASDLAATFGFRPSDATVDVRSVVDARAPKLGIVWEDKVTIPRFTAPPLAIVFARERWTGAPLLAGMRRGAGAVLWAATSPGAHGYSRYPYLSQALADLGVHPAFRSRRLWAFFDSSYRSRVDLDYFAPKWRQAGIAALHVAAWHYWESDPGRDAFLRRLIDACHRNAIQVYAWLELPHVSERFWQEHPEWREKTALGQDAHLDWRKLMNLSHPDARRAVAQGAGELLNRFDWDGVNLAELYFESLEGHDNPARFTPMNETVRAEFRAQSGFDPLEIFDPVSPRHHSKTAAPLAKFLAYRAELAARQQVSWIEEIEAIRAQKPWLDLVLTHVDDRFDTSMREKIGADTAKTLPLLTAHDFTFLIEDPATVWDLGPQRYPQIAARYRGATPRQDKLAIDINIVERYQDVYPTKQQTGIELFDLVHTAAQAFPRVALYFESSIPRLDWPLLASAASTVSRIERAAGKLAVESARGAGVAWSGPAMVDGRPWPVLNDDTVWLPPGSHVVQSAAAQTALRVLDLNAELRSASAMRDGIEFTYESSARAWAVLDRAPSRIEIDGVEVAKPSGPALMLPRGQHVVAVYR